MYTPATYDGRGYKRRQTASNPPPQDPVLVNDDGSMTLEDDDQDDDDDVHTMYSQTTMDAARARANAVLNQADRAKVSSFPPSSLQQAAAGMGPQTRTTSRTYYIRPIWRSSNFISYITRFQ